MLRGLKWEAELTASVHRLSDVGTTENVAIVNSVGDSSRMARRTCPVKVTKC